MADKSTVPGTAAELKELIREAHGVSKDLARETRAARVVATELRDLIREATQAGQAYSDRIAAQVCDLVDDDLREILQARIDKVVADAAADVLAGVDTISQRYDRDFAERLNRWLREVEKLAGHAKAVVAGDEGVPTLIKVPHEIARLLVGTDKE